MDDGGMEFLERLAEGICAQFGSACEVAIHDLSNEEHPLVSIRNGHVTGREEGDGPSEIVRQAIEEPEGRRPDRLGYLTTTSDGRILKSSTIYEYGDDDRVHRVFSINLDISGLLSAKAAIDSVVGPGERADEEERTAIPPHVEDVLDELIAQSIRVAGGKPPVAMSRQEKKAAVQYLSDAGAFLITKAGDRIARQFGISKYTMYSYIGAPRGAESNHGA